MPLKYRKVKAYLEDVSMQPESSARMPTIRELMGQFNVSLATVNRALNELENDGLIVRRQGARIVPAGRNHTVKRLSGKTMQRQIIFAYSDYPDENIWNMVHLIETYSRRLDCEVVACKLHPDTTTRDLIDFIRAQSNCEGMILHLGSVRMDAERLQALEELPMRIALVDSMYFYPNRLPGNIYVLSPDAAGGARLIAELLLTRGHRKIGFIRNEPWDEYTELHQKTLMTSLRQGGADFDTSHIFSTTIRPWENSVNAAVQLTRDNLDAIRELGLTALIYKSSIGAVAAFKVLQRAGLRIPDKISVIAEGDRSLYEYLDPGLTAVSADYSQMGKTAVEIVLGMQTPENHNLFFPLNVIERESVNLLTERASK